MGLVNPRRDIVTLSACQGETLVGTWIYGLKGADIKLKLASKLNYY